MLSPRTLLFTTLTTLLTASVPALAQPAAPLSESVTVDLVNVEVRVVDDSGQPVTGLPQEAFRILEDGRPVAVSHFAWVPQVAAATGTPGAPLPEASTAEPLHLVALFDELQTGDRSRGNLIGALRSHLGSRLRPEDQVTLLRFDGTELEMVLDASTDRKRLAESLDRLGVFSTRRLLSAANTRSNLQSLVTDVIEGRCQHTAVYLRLYAESMLDQVRSSATALLRAAHGFDADARRKVLLHVSDGIPMIAGGEAYQYAIEMCDGTAMAQGVPGAFNTLLDGADQETARDRFDPAQAKLEFAEYSTAKLWTDVASRINTLGVTIYTLQAGPGDSQFMPEIENGRSSASARMFARENPRETLAFLARETGGLMIDATAQESAGTARMIADLSGFYSLAFAPSPDGRAGLRTLRVEVDRAGVELRHRQSYRMMTRHERIAGQLLVLFESAHLENPLGVRVSVDRPPVAPRGEVVVRAQTPPTAERTARIAVPWERLQLVESGGAGQRSGRLTVFLTVRRKNGSIVPVRQRTVDVALTPPAPGAVPPTDFIYTVSLPEGASEVAAALLDEFSGKLSYARGRVSG